MMASTWILSVTSMLCLAAVNAELIPSKGTQRVGTADFAFVDRMGHAFEGFHLEIDRIGVCAALSSVIVPVVFLKLPRHTDSPPK
jgi:hypothetical protein